MSELDDLRRVAYGRTTSAAEEAAAADARAALARHDAAVRAERAALEADEFVRTRGAGRSPAADGQHDADTDADEPATLTIVDVGDEPGYLHRLAATWRVWAVPAFAAFVTGIVLTVASGLMLVRGLPVGDGTASDAPESNTSQRYLDDSGLPEDTAVASGTLALETGDLEAATAVLARPRGEQDPVADLDASIVPDSTRLLRSLETSMAYAGMSQSGDICLILVSTPVDTTIACAPPSSFPTQGLNIGRASGNTAVRVHWDGIDVVETVTTQ